MRVTIETTVDDIGTIEGFLDLYRDAFAPLAVQAAGRQSLTDDEFRAEMAEESVLKFVGWDRHDTPVALALVATDLSHVPWISPAFWIDRYPDHAARGAIWYYGALLVDPTAKGGFWTRRLMVEMARHTAIHRAVAAFDCCRFNVEDVKVPQMVAEISNRLAHSSGGLVDTQSYYAFVFDGLRDEIDLRAADASILVADTSEPDVEPGSAQ